MRTLDIAIKYQKNLDLKQYPITDLALGFSANAQLRQAENKAEQQFEHDTKNHKSNVYYRNICYSTAFFHLLFKAHGWTSFFDVACQIIEKHKQVIETEFEQYLSTAYPKVMLDDWIKYCEELKTKTEILEGECREEYFMVAYHYIIQPEILFSK